MTILHNGKEKDPEVKISGQPDEYMQVAHSLLSGQKTVTVAGEQVFDKLYSVTLKSLIFEIESYTPDKAITIGLIDSNLYFRGGEDVIRHLAQSFVNFFSTNVKRNKHFHLDYYEGNQLLAPTDFHITFGLNA